MINRSSMPREPAIVVLVVAALVATVAASAITASMNAPELLLVILLAIGALAIAMLRPSLLFCAYCAAIPFNFALPPGPAGTVARIAGLAFFLGYLLRRPDSLRLNTIPVVGWLFVGWTLVSCLWAIDSTEAFQAWLSLAQLFAITVLIASLVAADARTGRNGLWAYAISATATAGIGTISYLGGPTVFLARAVAFAEQDPAMFASVILPAIIFLMGEVQSRANGPFVRLLVVGALALCAVGVALSGTRSAWIGIVVASGVWLLLQRDRRQILAVAALALGVAILVAAVPGMGDFLFGRVETSVSSGGSGRTNIWVVGLSILAAAPLIGVGLANFPVAFSPSAIAQAPAGAAVENSLYLGRAPHNVLLGTVVETGLVGGVLFVAFFATALRQHARGGLATVVRVVLVGLYVQSMFLDILFQKQLWLFLAIAFGLAAAERAGVAVARAASAEGPGGVSGAWDGSAASSPPVMPRILGDAAEGLAPSSAPTWT